MQLDYLSIAQARFSGYHNFNYVETNRLSHNPSKKFELQSSVRVEMSLACRVSENLRPLLGKPVKNWSRVTPPGEHEGSAQRKPQGPARWGRVVVMHAAAPAALWAAWDECTCAGAALLANFLCSSSGYRRSWCRCWWPGSWSTYNIDPLPPGW